MNTYSHPRFFCENVNAIVSRSAEQQSAQIVVRKIINLGKMQGKLCFILKNMGCFFCAEESPQTDPFFGDMNFLGSSATIIPQKVIVMGNLPV